MKRFHVKNIIIAATFALMGYACAAGAVSTYASEEAQEEEISEELEEILQEVNDAAEILDVINETWEGDYDETPTGYEVYQLKRLMVLTDGEIMTESYGATSVYYYDEYSQYMLQFDSEVDTAEAYLQLVEDFGEDACFIDEVITADILSDVDGIKSYSALTWGATTMGMNYLKGEYDYYLIDTEVTVAIIDSGVDTTSSIFDGRIDERHSLCFTGDDDTEEVSTSSAWKDELGHGTHVAGIVAECTPENVSIMVLRCFDADGESSNFAIRTAAQYAVTNGADVLNMSLGWTGTSWKNSTLLKDVLASAQEEGTIVVAAAGNKMVDVANTYPANQTNVITVTGIDSTLTFASSYSNYGDTVDFCAPGTKIISTYLDGGKGSLSGTSMSCPHVSAAVAYVKMINKSAKLSTVKSVLKSYAVDLGTTGWDVYYGYGYINIHDYFDDLSLTTRYSDYDDDGEEKVEATATFAKTTVTKTYGASAFTVKLTTNSTGKVTYASSKASVATVDREGYIIIKGKGSCTITATVAADENYASTTAKFKLTVNAKSIANKTVKLSQTDYTYDGSSKKPSVTISGLSKSNYKVTYSDNKLPGVATVTVTGKGNYTGTATATFTIQFSKSPTLESVINGSEGVVVSWSKLSGAASYSIYRKCGGGSWKKIGSSETLSYTDTTAKSNKTYTYKIKAVKDTVTSSFSDELSIKVFSAPKVKVAYTGTAVKVTWKKVAGATKYEVYCKTGSGSLKLVKTTKKLAYTLKSFKKNVKYTFVVKAVNSTKKSAKSVSKYCYTLKTMTVKKATLSSKELTVKWTKNSVASGYQIQYSSKKNFATKKTVTVSKKLNSYTIEKLSKSKYYVRIRAYKTSGGVKYYSAWSDAVLVEASDD